MNEHEIAIQKILPYLRKSLRWPERLISSYGRVPVQIGSSTVWADFVCYIAKGHKPAPWLLVEVKQSGAPLEQAVPQAESYSLILGAPFFCVTDGREFQFFSSGSSQGTSIRLQAHPPIPAAEYLAAGVEYVSFPPIIDGLIELFLAGLRDEPKFLADTRKHDADARALHDKVFQRISVLSPQDVKRAIEDHVMIKRPNRNRIFSKIDQNFAKFKALLKFMRDFLGDPAVNINRLLDHQGPFYIPGAGLFFISQLLAGAHPDEYVVLEEAVPNSLRCLGITDILVKNDTANGYVYINDICKKLFRDKLKPRLTEYGFGLAAVHNFLWHYHTHYRVVKKWEP
jgi:hypothetical protein